MIQYLRAAVSAALKGTALLRLDFNTEDEWRLIAALPTVRFLVARADKIVIVSHRGRPDGIPDPAFSLRKDGALLQKKLRRPIVFISHFRFEEIKEVIRRAPRHSIFLLENIRFVRGEAENDPKLGKQLASLADYYVNDSFAVDHRANASLVAVTKFLPSFAGLEIEKEIAFLSGVLKAPRIPLVLVIGGAKAHDKLGVIEQFRRKATAVLVGGGSANTLLYLRGVDVGTSKVDDDTKDLAILKKVISYPQLVLPLDWKSEDSQILDIGPRTVQEFARYISKARTVIWSGPMGLIEKKKFAAGNTAIARAIARNRKAFSLTGGGETVAFLKKHKLDRKFSFISTGGGAFLEFLAGEKLPAIEALKQARPRKNARPR